jgi:tripartite-type tricarboxylate transporter receptor subunit TctC
MIKRFATAAAAAALTFSTMGAAHADAVSDFYKGKTVTIYVGLAAGGVYSTIATIMARYMPAHIPGNPTVIVEHQPGAGGLVSSNNVYNVLPKDGTILHTPNGGLTKRIVLGEPAARIDPKKWNWLGGWGEAVNDCTVWKKSPATTLEEAKQKVDIIGAIDTGSNTYTNPMLMNNILGTKFKIVPGYGGGSQIRLAMEKGEVDGFCGQFEGWKSVKPEWLREGRLSHLVQLASKRSPDMPNTPLLSEFARNDEERQIFEFVQSGVEDRAMVMAPGVPADRVAAMEKAYMETLADPKFVEEASRSQFEITPVSGAEIRAYVDRITAMKPDTIQKIKKAEGIE